MWKQSAVKFTALFCFKRFCFFESQDNQSQAPPLAEKEAINRIVRSPRLTSGRRKILLYPLNKHRPDWQTRRYKEQNE